MTQDGCNTSKHRWQTRHDGGGVLHKDAWMKLWQREEAFPPRLPPHPHPHPLGRGRGENRERDERRRGGEQASSSKTWGLEGVETTY